MTPGSARPAGRPARQVEIIHVDVDLDDVQAGHALDSLLDVALDAPAEISDADAVFHDDVQVDRGLGLAHLDADTLGDARAGAARNPLPDHAEGAAGRRAHGVHAADLAAGDPAIFWTTPWATVTLPPSASPVAPAR